MTYQVAGHCIAEREDAFGLFGMFGPVGRIAAALISRYSVVHELLRIEPRMLADMGIRTEDVYAALAEPLWRDPMARLKALAAERRSIAEAQRSSARKTR